MLIVVCIKVFLFYGIEYVVVGVMLFFVFGELVLLFYMMFMFKWKKKIMVRWKFFVFLYVGKDMFFDLMGIVFFMIGSCMIGLIFWFLELIVVV